MIPFLINIRFLKRMKALTMIFTWGIGLFFLAVLVCDQVYPIHKSIFPENKKESFSIKRDMNHNPVALAMLPADINSKVADSSRITKKIIPVIRKSIERYPGYYLFIFLGGFIVFALIRIIDPSFLRSIFDATLNINLLLGLFKEGIFGFNITSLLLDLVCICMTGIYIQVFFFSAASSLFLWILGFTAIAYILKLILIQFFANVFMGRAEATVHILMQLLFMRMLGLVLLPLLFFALYQPIFGVHELLRFSLTVISIIYVVWLVRLFIKMKSVGKVNILYLFLYLCTVEISTLAILLRNYIQ